jgi:hypothetical protein
MVKRFIERFQLWREERAAGFEDKFVAWLLFLVVLFVARDVYRAVTIHHLAWSAVSGTMLVLAFTVLYIRRSRWAWLVLLILAIDFIATAGFAYATAPPHLSPGVRILGAAFMIFLGLAAFIYSLVIRKRFARSNHAI